MLYLLGITCPIRRWEVWDVHDDTDDAFKVQDIPRFTICMTLANPTRLHLRLGPTENLEDIARLAFPVIASAGVKELKILLYNVEPVQAKAFVVRSL